jgi:hypothetical protein
MYLFDKEAQEFIAQLNEQRVEYLIVGGFAVNYHGYLRGTGDMDIWWNPTPNNFKRLLSAIQAYGFETTQIEHLQKYDSVKSLIRLPLRDNFDIELLSLISGKFSFETAYSSAEESIMGGVPIKIIDYAHLIENKMMSRRMKDLLDVSELDKIKQVVKGKKKQ